MPDDAEVYQKTADDKVIILNPRAYFVQGFKAPGWTDLRVGWFLSLTDDTGDDVTGGLAETIVAGAVAQPSDRYWLGVKTRGNAMPGQIDRNSGDNNDGIVRTPPPIREGGRTPPPPRQRPSYVTFIGFTNRYPTGRDARGGDSVLSSSDEQLGTSNTNFWRPNNSLKSYYSFVMMDQLPRARGGINGAALAQHFPQSAGAVAAGYAVLLGMRLTRDTPTSRTITAYVKSADQSADMLYSNTPTKELIRDTLQSWPASQMIGPASLANVPEAFYFYWPFRNSRLRIHSVGILKAA